MKTGRGLNHLGRGLPGLLLAVSLAGGAGAQTQTPLPPPATPPGARSAAPASNAPASQAAKSVPRPSAAPAESSAGIDWPTLLIAAALAAGVSAATAYGVLNLLRKKEPVSTAAAATAPAWAEFEYFRNDVLEVLKQVRSKAGSLDSVPESTVQDWTKQLARARADLERAPLSKADYEPLRQLYVEVSKIGQEMSERAKRSRRGEDLAGSLFSFTQALSRRASEAAQVEKPAASGEGGAGRAEVRRLEEQLERGNSGLVEQIRQLSGRIESLEKRPTPTLGHLVEEEFRVLCESRAAELERSLAGMKGRAGSAAPAPPVVPAALAVAEAALKVSEEAIKARGLDAAVKAQLTNLAPLASTLQAMCPVAVDQGGTPSVEAIRRLPERPEARWQPEMVARGGSVINAVTAYWSEVNRLLQAEAGPLEQWLAGAAHDSGARDAAVGDWLSARLLPLLDQAGAAVKEDGPARREAREGGASGLVAALDLLHRACDRVTQGTGLEARVARKGETVRPQAGVKVDFASAGQPPDTVLEVRQIGWSWNGRLLRELHVVVQEETGSTGTRPNGAPDGGPSPVEEGPRVKRL